MKVRLLVFAAMALFPLAVYSENGAQPRTICRMWIQDRQGLKRSWPNGVPWAAVYSR